MLLKIGSRIAASVLAVALALCAGSASGQSSKAVINAATITTFPPYESKDPTTNKLVGFEIDVVEAMAAKMGAKINWIESSFDQLVSFNSLKTKRADIIVGGVTDTAERRVHVSFVDHMYYSTVFVVLRSNAANFPDPGGICGKRVAVTRSSTMWLSLVGKWSEDNCTKIGKAPVVVLPAESGNDSILQLNQGRADVAVLADGAVARLNTTENNRYLLVGKPFLSQPLGIAFPKEDPQFGEALRKALADVIADGTYTRLLRKYNFTDDAGVKEAMINRPL